MEKQKEKQHLLADSHSFRRRRKTRLRQRSCCATCCSLYSTAAYFVTLVLTVFYMGFFIQLDTLVDSKEPYSDQCILFSRYSKNDPQFTLGYDFSCELSVYGTVALALLLFILMVMLFFNSILGRWVKWLKVVEVIMIAVCAFLSCLLSILLSLGYSLTCNAQRLYEGNNGRCSELTLPETDIPYGNHMLIVEIVSWMVTVILIFMFLIQLLVSLFLGCGNQKKPMEVIRPEAYQLRTRSP